MRTALFCVGAIVVAVLGSGGGSGVAGYGEGGPTTMPAAHPAGPMSLEEAIGQRRSVREFADRRLTLEQIGQLCWAGQGITDPVRGFRACPSAGALYPMELYIVTADGVEHYQPRGHSLERHVKGDLRRALQEAGLGQAPIGEAPACVVITAVVERTAGKYGRRAERYCLLEAGHVAQNILLQATALNLGGVPIGAFDDKKVAAALKLPKGHQVLYLLPLGHPRR